MVGIRRSHRSRLVRSRRHQRRRPTHSVITPHLLEGIFMFSSLSSSLLWRGLLAVAVGVVSVTWPNITIGAFVILFAIYAFSAAGGDAVRAFSSDHAGPVAGYLLLALLSLAAGLIALLWPGITALVLTIWVAAWAFVTGVIEVVLAFGQRETAGERAMWALSGLVSIALGVVLALRPDVGALTLATVFGLFSIVNGISALVLSTQARRTGTSAGRLANSPA
jgi:uncharacterized membrane protein HdeD (DUF308 family)